MGNTSARMALLSEGRIEVGKAVSDMHIHAVGVRYIPDNGIPKRKRAYYQPELAISEAIVPIAVTESSGMRYKNIDCALPGSKMT